LQYYPNKPKASNYENQIRRPQAAIEKKRVELLKDPKYIKELAEIKEKARKVPRRADHRSKFYFHYNKKIHHG
jgi:hypothetical protein